jgi:hypothetical protein
MEENQAMNGSNQKGQTSMVRIRPHALLVGAVAGLWLLGAAPTAKAAPIVPNLLSVTALGDGTFRWDYNLVVDAGERVQSTGNTVPPGQSRADFATWYDFAGLVGTPTGPAGWTASVQNIGINPDFASPPLGDNPAIPNVTFTYTGAAAIPPGTTVATFSILSIFGEQTVGSFAAETTRDGTSLDNTSIYTSLTVPVPVPEPGTILPALAGPLFVFGAVRRGLRPRPAAAV